MTLSGRHAWWYYMAPVLLAVLAAGSGFAKNASEEDDLVGPPRRIGIEAPSVVPSQTLSLTSVSGNPLWAIPLQSLQATRERPLFRPSRRPKATIVAAPPAPIQKVALPPAEPDTPTLKLIGLVVGSSEDTIAVFIANGTRDIVRLRIGEGHDGWILQSIAGREAVLEKGKRSVVLELPQLKGR